MLKYEAPIMIFEELTLFEKIADKCWGAGSFTFDNPYDSSNEIHSFCISGGCDRGQLDPSDTVLSYVENYMSGSQFEDFTASYGFNLSNTHASGFHCHSGYKPTPTPTPTPKPCHPGHGGGQGGGNGGGHGGGHGHP